MAADGETTATSLPLEFDHDKKIEKLGNCCVVMASGDSLVGSEVTGKARVFMARGENNTVHRMVGTLKKLYTQIHLERAEGVILIPRGLTLKESQERGSQQLPVQVCRERW